MKRGWRWLVGCLAVGMLLLGASPRVAAAQSGPPEDGATQINYCARSTYDESRCVPFSTYTSMAASQAGKGALIGLTQGISWLIWQLGRITIHISRFIVSENWVETLRSSLLSAIQQIVPATLDRLLFDAQSGLLFLMLFLTGILMILPLRGLHQRFVGNQAEILTWGVIVTFFFIRTFMGYDLIREFDTVRVSIMRLALQGGGNGLVFEAPFVNPFMARSEEVERIDDVLPQAYTARFFPPAQTQQITVAVGTGLLFGNWNVLNVNVETEASLNQRLQLAFQSIFHAVLGAIGFLIVFVSSLSVFVINLSAIAAILLFFAALPAGFFVPGRSLILRIVNIYVTSLVFGILVGGVMRILGAVSWMPSLGGAGGDLAPLRLIPALVMSLTAFFILQLVSSSLVRSITNLQTTFMSEVVSFLSFPGDRLPVPSLVNPVVPGSSVDWIMKATTKAVQLTRDSIPRVAGGAVRSLGGVSVRVTSEPDKANEEVKRGNVFIQNQDKGKVA